MVLERPDEDGRGRDEVQMPEQSAQRPGGALAREQDRVLLVGTNRVSHYVPGLVPATQTGPVR